MTDWQDRLDEIEIEQDLEHGDPEPAPLPCNECGRASAASPCPGCGRHKW